MSLHSKRTILIRDEFYERLRRDAFFGRREIKDILDEIMAEWIAAHPEESHRPLPGGSLLESKANLEIEEIKNAMESEHYYRERAAKVLGITRMALNVKCRKYGLTFPKGPAYNKKR